MEEYHKIQSIFKRDKKTHKFIENEWALPELEYLKDNQWSMTEKIDGTNIRIGWIPEVGMNIGGRTDNAQIPTFLYQKLTELFTNTKLTEAFPDTSVMLCGEGYGAKIQKGGGKYLPDGVDFILFDIWCGGYWLRGDDVSDIALQLGAMRVPRWDAIALPEAVELVKGGLKSYWKGREFAEGIVLRTPVGLLDRGGKRIITKIKHKDFTEDTK